MNHVLWSIVYGLKFLRQHETSMIEVIDKFSVTDKPIIFYADYFFIFGFWSDAIFIQVAKLLSWSVYYEPTTETRSTS